MESKNRVCVVGGSFVCVWGGLVMAWRAFNALMGDTKLLVLDTRTARSYGERHIRGSVCVELSSNGRTLEKVAGPGPPTWSRNCWWGRNVLIVSPNYSRKSGKRRTSSSKSRRDDGEGGEDQEERERKKRRKNPQESADGAEEAEPVVKFLLKEGCVKSVKVLEVGDGMYVCMQLLHSVLSLSLSLTDF